MAGLGKLPRHVRANEASRAGQKVFHWLSSENAVLYISIVCGIPRVAPPNHTPKEGRIPCCRRQEHGFEYPLSDAQQSNYATPRTIEELRIQLVQ
jgi:hypothetical protein